MTDPGLLDETYTRLRDTGPEFEGWLSNHAPMVADALIRLGRADAVAGWVDRYLPRLQDAPRPMWPINPADWREPLGDPSRLGDWRELLARQVSEEPWETVLLRWWPRLLPGAAASAGHGLIRTGHAVRALREHDTAPRRRELAEALAYWAARWLPVHPPARPGGVLPPAAALDALPGLAGGGAFRTRLADTTASDRWPDASRAAAPARTPEAVPVALDALVAAAVARYADWGYASPIMLVHAATAPRAVALTLPTLPREMWPAAFDAAWAVTAALVGCYRPAEPSPQDKEPHRSAQRTGTRRVGDAVDRAVLLADEHAITVVETACNGDPTPQAVSSADLAVSLLADDQ